MEIKFIGQGLDPSSDITTGNYIISSLIDEQFIFFNAFVAFVSIGGINNIIDQLIEFKRRSGTIRLYVGVDLNGTSKEALDKLLELEIETYIVFTPNNIIYHPKIYIFEGDNSSRIIVGSSNFTERGLFQSIESSVCVNFENNDEVGTNFLTNIYKHYNDIIKNDHPSCQKLTTEILEILVNSKIVLPEIIIRDKSSKINREFGEKDSVAYDLLLKSFGKLRLKRPPKGFKKAISKEEILIEKNKNPNILIETIELSKGSMWIETGKMTGGSSNQLDMSKKGNLNGEKLRGSASYFGIDPENPDEYKELNIHFGGKIYIGNPLSYREGNSNWRLLLKGVTANQEKLTSITKLQLGQDSGFINKILLFTKIDESNYKLEKLELEEKEKLIDHSSIWGNMGQSSNGRAYGFI